MGKSSKIVTIGQGPGALNVVLVAGTVNTLSLRRTGLDDLPEAWPSAPVLNLRNNVHAISYTAAATLSDNGTVATWVIPALNSPPPTDPNRPTESQLVLDGIPIYAGSVRCLDPWQDSAYSPATRDISVIAGPPGANGTPGADGAPGAGAVTLPNQVSGLVWQQGSETGYIPSSTKGLWSVTRDQTREYQMTLVAGTEGAAGGYFANGRLFCLRLNGAGDGTLLSVAGSDTEWDIGASLVLPNGDVLLVVEYDPNTEAIIDWKYTTGDAAPIHATGTPPSQFSDLVFGILGISWVVDSSSGDWFRINSQGAWVSTTPPAGVGGSDATVPVGWGSGVLAWDGTGWHYCDPEGVWVAVPDGPTNPPITNVNGLFPSGTPSTETLAAFATEDTDNPAWYVLHTWSPDTGWDQPALGPFTSICPLSDGWVYNYVGTQWRIQSVSIDGWREPQVPVGFAIKAASGRIGNVLFVSTDSTWVLDNSNISDIIPTTTRLSCIENRLTALENP